ncbi:cytochrome D1 domain-containing protein, partial [Acinetobacter baumannii]
AASDDDVIQIIDTATRKIVGRLPSGEDPEQFSIDPAGKFLYVANENDAKVTIIDLATRKTVGQIPVGIEPEGIAISPDG